MLQAAFGESCLSWSKTFEWYSHSKSGCRSFEDNPRPGRLSTSHTEETVAHVREIIHADWCLTIRKAAKDGGIAFGMSQKILTEKLQIRHVSAKFVPCLLMVEQKDDHLSVCTDLCERAQNNPKFISSVITGDESWVYRYDPETKKMYCQWKTASSPRPKKTWQVKSNVRTMLIAFFNIDGLVLHDYVTRGQMVNKEFYKTVLQCLHDTVCRHHPEKWHSSNWILHHDKAPAHRTVTTKEFLVKHNILSLPYPPYSPDLALCDVFLFLQLKRTMKVRRFDDGEIQANTMRQMRAITKSDYKGCFCQWQECWNKCVQAQGHYFKGDKTN